MLIHYSSNDNLENLLKENKNVVIDFYADWCGPCKMLSPLIEDASKDFTDVTFIKINVDHFRNEAMQYRVNSIPSLFYIKNGIVVDSSLGFMPYNMLKEKISKLVK